jgi:ribonuclease BN (tRNA processing enzyme)
MGPHPVTLTVTVLGADGSYPGPGGACSGYLLACAGTRVWMDAGSGTLANLQRHVAIEDLDAVVISHQHPDHWTDLEHLAVACRWVVDRPGIPVFAPDGLRELTRVGSATDTFEWHTIAGGDQVTIGEMRLTFSQTDHPVPTLAMRIDGAGRSLGYSADSGPDWGLAALGPGLHLALCEATFLSDKEGTVQHLSARQAGLTARAAGVNRLVITHLSPRVDREAARAEAESSFGADVAVAGAGDRYVA